jgi:ElaB/YqjD/DUF883 family membrane-anchored ribosome-binding protein
MNTTHPINKNVLIADTKLLLSDAQEILQLIADQTSESVTDLRFRLEDKIAKYKKDLARLQDATVTKVTEAGRATDDYVHHEPWKAIGIAAGIAFVVGMLVCRRGRD